MVPASAQALGADRSDATQPDDKKGRSGLRAVRRLLTFPYATLALTGVFLGFLALPRVQGHATLRATFLATAAVLLAWHAILWTVGRARRLEFRAQWVAVKAHWVQAAVQGFIYVWWGFFHREVYAQVPLILAQLVFLYVLSALLAWSRGREWQVGFGPLPIIFSTNLLLWFRDDAFYLQFLMVATGALGKEFVTWRREGRRTHIFNPSVFGQSLFALGLIFTGTTQRFTLGEEIAFSFEETPHILLVLFGVGLVVQSMFHVTLMTLCATASLGAINLIYTGITGTYLFVSLNIGATVFLGLHLLMTDPSTSPRSNLGRVIFGSLYGVGYTILFIVFDRFDVPLFWDKLLPVPVLNLLVPLIDRVARAGVLGRLTRAWETALNPARLNAIHMACWSALFLTMFSTGFLRGRHEGASLAFWRKAYQEDRYRAGYVLLKLVQYGAARGQPEHTNMLGKLFVEGDLVEENHAAAAHLFAKACATGYFIGCENVAGTFLFLSRGESEAEVRRALDRLEQEYEARPDGVAAYLLGVAYETGRLRPFHPQRAQELFALACSRGHSSACERMKDGALSGGNLPAGRSLHSTVPAAGGQPPAAR